MKTKANIAKRQQRSFRFESWKLRNHTTMKSHCICRQHTHTHTQCWIWRYLLWLCRCTAILLKTLFAFLKNKSNLVDTVWRWISSSDQQQRATIHEKSPHIVVCAMYGNLYRGARTVLVFMSSWAYFRWLFATAKCKKQKALSEHDVTDGRHVSLYSCSSVSLVLYSPTHILAFYPQTQHAHTINWHSDIPS